MEFCEQSWTLVCVCVCVMSVTARISAQNCTLLNEYRRLVVPISPCRQLSGWRLLFQISNKRLVPSLQIHYTPLLLKEAKLVLQKQNADKRGNTKVGFINSCKQNYLKRCEIKIRRKGRKGRVRGGRKSATVAGKSSHSCFFRFPSKHLLWSGGVLAVPSVVAATLSPSPDGLFPICIYCMWKRYSQRSPQSSSVWARKATFNGWLAIKADVLMQCSVMLLIQ